MKTIGAPFQVEKSDSEVKLIGWGDKQRKAFMKLFLSEAKEGKIYQHKIIEVTAAEVHRNYMFLCLSFASEFLGRNTDSLRVNYEQMVFESANDPDNDFFEAKDWLIDIVTVQGEFKGQSIKHMSDWSVSMMNSFIELIQQSVLDIEPNFKFPDSKLFTGTVKGLRNEIVSQNDYSIVKI